MTCPLSVTSPPPLVRSRRRRPITAAYHPLMGMPQDADVKPPGYFGAWASKYRWRQRAAVRDQIFNRLAVVAPVQERAAADKRTVETANRLHDIIEPGCARVAWTGGSQDALYRAWVAVGERLASFNGKLRDELLDRELFYTLLEVRVLTERYRRTYNRIRPHSSLGYRPPAPEALLPADPVPVLVGLTYHVVQTVRRVTAQFLAWIPGLGAGYPKGQLSYPDPGNRGSSRKSKGTTA